jgi:hypothetical protein
MEVQKVISDELQATALANIQQLYDRLKKQSSTIDEQGAEIKHLLDRVEMLVEDRNYFRKQALKYRAWAVELCTIISNIGLLTIPAQEKLKVIDEDEPDYEEKKDENEKEKGATRDRVGRLDDAVHHDAVQR